MPFISRAGLSELTGDRSLPGNSGSSVEGAWEAGKVGAGFFLFHPLEHFEHFNHAHVLPSTPKIKLQTTVHLAGKLNGLGQLLLPGSRRQSRQSQVEGGAWQTEKQNWGSRREGRLREGLPVQGRILVLSGETGQSTGLEEGLYQTCTQQAWWACLRLRHLTP